MFKGWMYSILFLVCACPLAHADQASSHQERADYGVLFGFSPFGGSMTFSTHSSSQTTWQCSIGGNPEGTFDIAVGQQAYTLRTRSSWVGWFVNHRPVRSAQWFRLVTGFAIGNIEHRLHDPSGNVFSVDYKESPVGYVGIGTGVGTGPGFTFGFDIGWLQSAGPTVSFHRGPSMGEMGALSAEAKQDRIDQISDDFFFGSFMPNIQVGVGYNF